ncbi:hypothetical protein STEG23_025630 [Scotinomys teguina]
MPCVHYKFSSRLKYDTIIFDGLHISLCNLRKQIMEREKLKAANSHLQIFNADTGEEYSDDNAPIPKNSSVTVRRIPGVGAKSRGKSYSARRTEPVMGTAEANGDASAPLSLAQLARTANLAEANASEEDKIKAMMLQCGRVYTPTNSTKKPLGLPPPSYICFRCGRPGHHIKSCPTIRDEKFDSGPRIRRCTGIPTSFLMEVKDPHTKGAMLTNTGKLVIPIIDAEAYAIGKKEKPPFLPEEPSSSSPSEEGDPVPEELLCPICEDIMVDAAIIPCCGNSYCDECIRTALLESDEHTCPTCHQDDVSPDALAANQVLRRAVNNFENGTGYTKGPRKQFPPPPPPPPPLPIPPPRGQTQKTPQPLMKSPLWRQQDPLMIPVTSSSAQTTPSVASLTSDPSPSAARVPGNASSAPAPVPDATATGSILVHSEKSDGPLRDPDDKLLPTAAIGSEQSKGAASTETTALGEEKGSQVPVLGPPSLPGQSSLQGLWTPTTGPGPLRKNGGGRPGWGHSKKLGDLVSPAQQIRRGQRGRDRSMERKPQHSNRPHRPQAPSPPATPMYPPPLQKLPLAPGVPPPQFSARFPPDQPRPSGYSVPGPGFPPPPASIGEPCVWSAAVQTAHSSTIHTRQAPLLSREEFYREQRRLREEERKRSKLDEFTNDFPKELTGSRKIEKKRRRSFSRSKSPRPGSWDPRSSDPSSKSRCGSLCSSSSSGSFSRLHPRFCSPSPLYPRRGKGEESPNYGSRFRSRGYRRRSRSRSPLRKRPYYSGSRSPQKFQPSVTSKPIKDRVTT